MANKIQNSTHSYEFGEASNGITLVNELGDMPQLSSELVVLTFMYEVDMPLRPKAIYGGLINQQDITFSYRTVQNKISSLHEKGHIKKVKIDDSEGKIVDIPPDEDYRRAYYQITEEGKGRIEEEVL